MNGATKLGNKFKSHIVQAKKIQWTMNYIQNFIVTNKKYKHVLSEVLQSAQLYI